MRLFLMYKTRRNILALACVSDKFLDGDSPKDCEWEARTREHRHDETLQLLMSTNIPCSSLVKVGHEVGQNHIWFISRKHGEYIDARFLLYRWYRDASSMVELFETFQVLTPYALEPLKVYKGTMTDVTTMKVQGQTVWFEALPDEDLDNALAHMPPTQQQILGLADSMMVYIDTQLIQQ